MDALALEVNNFSTLMQTERLGLVVTIGCNATLTYRKQHGGSKYIISNNTEENIFIIPDEHRFLLENIADIVLITLLSLW